MIKCKLFNALRNNSIYPMTVVEQKQLIQLRKQLFEPENLGANSQKSKTA